MAEEKESKIFDFQGKKEIFEEAREIWKDGVEKAKVWFEEMALQKSKGQEVIAKQTMQQKDKGLLPPS